MIFRAGWNRFALLLAGLWTFAIAGFGAMCQVQDAVVAGGRVWTLCGREAIYSSADGGNSWQAVDLPPETLYRALVFVDDRRGFIVGDGGTLLASEDSGKTWVKRKVPTTEHLTDIVFVKESGWIAGRNGLILHSSDGGKTWARQETRIPQGLAAIDFVDERNGWAVGWMGVVLRTKNGGASWEPVKAGEASWSLNYVHFPDQKNGWITGMFGQLLRTADGGDSWSLVDAPAKGTLTSVYRSADGRLYATTGNDVLVSKDGGTKWEASGINQWLFLKRVVPVGGTLWAVGTFHILRWDSAKNVWTRLVNSPSSQAERRR